jgi:hypothetical protein
MTGVEVFDALKEIALFLKKKRFRFALIGGLAASCRGQARTTNDVDLTIWAEIGEELPILKAILKKFRARESDPIEFALANRVLLVKATNSVPIDIGLAMHPFEDEMLSRATQFEVVKGLNLPVLSAEDVVVTKVFAGRPRDWFDVEGLFDRLGPKLDYDAIVLRLEGIGELFDLNEGLAHLERIRIQANDIEDPES